MKIPTLKSCIKWSIAIFGYYLWFQTFYNAMCEDSLFPYKDFMDMLTGFSYNFPPILFVFLLNLLIVFGIVQIKDLKLKICIDVILSFSACLFVNWLYLGITGHFRATRVDWVGTILNDIIILLGVEMVYYFTSLSKSRQEIEEARRQTLMYQYDALKAQINPHFLFNSLNLLYSLVSIDSVKSKKFIHELARMYRYIMSQQNCERVSVAEEFDFLSSYVSVLEMRYNNKFEVAVSGTPPEDRQIIPFTMQLLIENVTKHNVISTKSPMTVTIDIGGEGIRISNPVNPKSSESVGKIGLRYLTKLYNANGREFRTENDGREFTAYVPFL